MRAWLDHPWKAYTVSIGLRHVVVHRPELGRRGRGGADRLEGGPQTFDEPLRVLLRLPDLDHSPAAVRTGTGDVEDPAGGPLQAEPLADPVIGLLRALGIVHQH